jgi:hypothetical protein
MPPPWCSSVHVHNFTVSPTFRELHLDLVYVTHAKLRYGPRLLVAKCNISMRLQDDICGYPRSCLANADSTCLPIYVFYKE